MQLRFTFVIALIFSSLNVWAQPWAENRPAAGTAHALPTRLFPVDNWWNLNVSAAPVEATSASLLSIYTGTLLYSWGDNYGAPWAVVSGDYPKVFFAGALYESESDLSIGYPIPAEARTENGWTEQLDRTIESNSFGADRHLIIIDKDNEILYEIYQPFYNATAGTVTWGADGSTQIPPGVYWCASAAHWDMKTNNTRPKGWTSSDAAGLQFMPSLAQFDEYVGTLGNNPITHAHGMTFNLTPTNWFVWPALHWAGGGGTIPLGARLRLKASKDITNIAGCGTNGQRLLQSLKDYGLVNADNGPSGQTRGTNDSRWGAYDSSYRVEIGNCFNALDMSDDFEILRFGWGEALFQFASPGDTFVNARFGARDLPFEQSCDVILKTSGGATITTNTLSSGPARRETTFTGLTAATSYKLAFSCAGQIPSTEIDFTTLPTAAGGNRTIPIQIGAPTTSLAALGAARCTFDYGTTTAVSDGSVQDTSCDSGGSVNLTIPAGVRYWRVRWQTSGDAILATGTPQPISIP